MHYKTIVLELIQQRSELHEQLRISRRLLPTLEAWGRELKTRHEAWRGRLWQATPGRNRGQIASEALELAVKELEDRLPSTSPRDEDEAV